MEMKARLVALTFASLCSGCVNYFPRDTMPFGAASNADAVAKVDGIVKAAGLVPVPITSDPYFNEGVGRPLELVADWKWPQRPSFTVGVIRRLPPGEGYFVDIEDSEIGGWNFVGPSCQKFLEIRAGLEAQSGLTGGVKKCDRVP